MHRDRLRGQRPVYGRAELRNRGESSFVARAVAEGQATLLEKQR